MRRAFALSRSGSAVVWLFGVARLGRGLRLRYFSSSGGALRLPVDCAEAKGAATIRNESSIANAICLSLLFICRPSYFYFRLVEIVRRKTHSAAVPAENFWRQ